MYNLRINSKIRPDGIYDMELKGIQYWHRSLIQFEIRILLFIQIGLYL